MKNFNLTKKPFTVIFLNKKEDDKAGLYETEDRFYLLIRKWDYSDKEGFNPSALSLAKLFWSKDFHLPSFQKDTLTETDKAINKCKELIKEEVIRINQKINSKVEECFFEILTYKGEVYDPKRAYYRDDLEVCNHWAKFYVDMFKNIKDIFLFGCLCDLSGQKEIANILRTKYKKNVTQGFWSCPHGNDTYTQKEHAKKIALNDGTRIVAFTDSIDLNAFFEWVTR